MIKVRRLNSHEQQDTDVSTKTGKANKPTTSKRLHSAVEADSQEDEQPPITDSCDVIRRKNTTFLNGGSMKVTKFLRTIKVNSNSHGRFMKFKGPYSGDNNQTCQAAFHFSRSASRAVLDVQRKESRRPTRAKSSMYQRFTSTVRKTTRCPSSTCAMKSAAKLQRNYARLISRKQASCEK